MIEAELRLQGWSRTASRGCAAPSPAGDGGADAAEHDGQGDLFRRRAAGHGGLGVRGSGDVAGSGGPIGCPLYRDRASAENAFDELKNQWGWGGFTTRDLNRCQHMARLIALIYNWWSLNVRLADPDHHREAITSRPLLLHGNARQTHHAYRSDPADGDIEPWAAQRGGRGFAADHRLLPDPGAKCGAVERRGSLAPDPGGSAEEVPPWPPTRPSTLASTASARAGGLKSTPRNGRPTPATAESRFIGARARTRTGTARRPTDFKSVASTKFRHAGCGTLYDTIGRAATAGKRPGTRVPGLAPHLSLSLSAPAGQRGDADGTGVRTPSPPRGGEGRGEVGWG